MGQILIRKIDDSALERLRTIASERNVPLEAHARDVLVAAAARPTLAERMESIRKLAELRSTHSRTDKDITPLIRAMRDGDDLDG